MLLTGLDLQGKVRDCEGLKRVERRWEVLETIGGRAEWGLFVDGLFGRRIPGEEKNEYYERKHGGWATR